LRGEGEKQQHGVHFATTSWSRQQQQLWKNVGGRAIVSGLLVWTICRRGACGRVLQAPPQQAAYHQPWFCFSVVVRADCSWLLYFQCDLVAWDHTQQVAASTQPRGVVCHGLQGASMCTNKHLRWGGCWPGSCLCAGSSNGSARLHFTSLSLLSISCGVIFAVGGRLSAFALALAT